MTQKNKQTPQDNQPVRGELYSILGRLIEAAEKNDSAEFRRLDKRYNELDFSVPLKVRPLEYGSCRKSCILAITTAESNRGQYVEHAREQFARLG